MKYNTTNEFYHFVFQEVHISDIQITNGFFHMVLDDVIILPENSCNRDIRKMRCNGLLLKLMDSRLISLMADGYKVYNANNELMEEYDDRMIDESEYMDICKNFVDGSVYCIVREEQEDGMDYIFSIDDVEGDSYTLTVRASGDAEEWDRFLNIEE